MCITQVDNVITATILAFLFNDFWCYQNDASDEERAMLISQAKQKYPEYQHEAIVEAVGLFIN